MSGTLVLPEGTDGRAVFLTPESPVFPNQWVYFDDHVEYGGEIHVVVKDHEESDVRYIIHVNFVQMLLVNRENMKSLLGI